MMKFTLNYDVITVQVVSGQTEAAEAGRQESDAEKMESEARRLALQNTR
jgi:hypothetical protein